MNKGYLIAHVTVSNAVAYAEYAKAAGEAMQAFSPKVIAWSGQYENLEGESHERHVVFEFASLLRPNVFMRVLNIRQPEPYVQGLRPGLLCWLKVQLNFRRNA